MDKINMVGDGVEEPSKELKEFIDKNMAQIKSSQIFLSLFTTSFEKSPLCMLQVSLAIFLDKPIYLLVEEGVLPSPKLIKLAEGWEFFKLHDKESLRQATLRIIDAAKLKGHWKEDK